MVGSRDQVIKKITAWGRTILTQADIARDLSPDPWQYPPVQRPYPRAYSRRQALKLLGLSTATGMVTVGCQSVSGKMIGPTGRPLKNRTLKTVKVDAEGQITAEPSVKVTYFDEPYLNPSLGKALPLRMVQIPAGEFLMGSPPAETQREEKEGPQRAIQVPSFYMGAFTITQQQYEVIMGENPSYFTDDQGKDGANLPVEQVTWQEAEAFCQKLSQLTGRTYRLPSEAEWEYACRAGTTTPFCFGEKLTTEIANFFADFSFTENFEENYRNTPVAVDSFWPNEFGLYNMHGNISEWCADDYHDSYQEAPSDAKPWKSADAQSSKVIRGGSWFNDTPFCRSASRDKNSQTGRSNVFGLRVVCEA
ncbi:formylglycine-generating enzyme family protein [Leptothoe sp. PORK10 BA2]|uniref:formylglycine-generating enzyme family protein n=1 Tax=Leptothoe sp. PORK10 BA2 TaxID=3110254 RepID=UPI002B203BAC|nr:formylglycine-generating enzyme family protein [Leptothoe sp. PORK10 BA2]MEA5466431.1 formylglycine-generating enzyme family protein [Leptothoe sp. PORK10 BA2]